MPRSLTLQLTRMVFVQEVRRSSGAAESRLPGKGDSSGDDNSDGYYTDDECSDTVGSSSVAMKTGASYHNGHNFFGKVQRARFVPLWLKNRVDGVWKRMCELYRLTRQLSWICTTTLLLVGLPVLFAYDREKNSQDQHLMLPSDTL